MKKIKEVLNEERLAFCTAAVMSATIAFILFLGLYFGFMVPMYTVPTILFMLIFTLIEEVLFVLSLFAMPTK